MEEKNDTIKTKKLFKNPNWEIYRPMRVTWVGFLIAWGVVFATIALTMIIARIGA